MSGSLSRRAWLLAAGAVSSAMALIHVGIVVVGEPAYRHFGGSSFAQQAAAGSLIPAAMLLTIAAVFALFAYYGFAGARLGPRPLLLRTGLIVISLLYGVHGLFVVPELVPGDGSALYHWYTHGLAAPERALATVAD